jgi:hypothetical protein
MVGMFGFTSGVPLTCVPCAVLPDHDIQRRYRLFDTNVSCSIALKKSG